MNRPEHLLLGISVSHGSEINALQMLFKASGGWMGTLNRIPRSEQGSHSGKVTCLLPWPQEPKPSRMGFSSVSQCFLADLKIG